MSGLVPRFVIDKETGKKCMQILLGSQSATLELPDGFGSWPDIRQQIFIENVVEEMTRTLHKNRLEEQRKIRRKLESDS